MSITSGQVRARPSEIMDPDGDDERPGPDAVATPAGEDDLVVEDLLVEDVSIDGMCGVY